MTLRFHKDSSIWSEKYRPQKLNELVLTKNVRTFLEYCIENKEIPNILLYGDTGTGKTSFVHVLANELKADYLTINGSLYNSIEVLRTDIMEFVSTYGMDDSELQYKIVFIDEAEKISPAFQEALKVQMEELSNNARFIFNTNNKHKIIEPLLGRFSQGAFDLIPSDRKERGQLAAEFLTRVKYILEQENMEYDEDVLTKLIIKHFPKFRNIVGVLQQYKILYGECMVDERILQFGKGLSEELIRALVTKDIKRQRVIAIDTDASAFYREFDTSMYNIIEDDHDNIVKASLILGKFANESGTTIDDLITLKACFATLSEQLKFKKLETE